MERKGAAVFDDDILDLDSLVHPSQVFEHPLDVVRDPDLSLNKKRAILASWASDACAIEAAPALRETATGRVVEFDDIMDALRILDKEVSTAYASGRYRTTVRSGSTFGQGGNDRSDQGSPLH